MPLNRLTQTFENLSVKSSRYPNQDIINFDPSGKVPFTITGITRTNLISNPSFEVNTSGWVENAGQAIALDSTNKFIGLNSLRITATNGFVILLVNGYTSATWVPVNSGQTYTASLYAMSTNTRELASIQINWYTSTSSFIASISGSSMPLSESWQRYGIGGIAPSNAAFCSIDFRVQNPGGSRTLSANVDAVLMEQSSFLSDYIDTTGSTFTNLTEWKNSAGTVLGKVDTNGNIFATGLSITNPTNITNGATFYNSAGIPVFNVDTSLNAVGISGGISGITNNFASVWGFDSFANAGYISFNTGQLGPDSLSIRRTNHVDSGDYTISTLGNFRLSTASGKNFNFNNGNIGIATTVIGTNNKIIVNPYSTVDNLATAQINTNAATNKGLVVQGIVSQTANLQEWQNSSGTVQTAIGAAGRILTNQRISIGTPVASPLLDAHSNFYNDNDATRVVMLVRGAASQTANLQEWQNSAGTVLSRMFSDGSLGVPAIYCNDFNNASTGNNARLELLTSGTRISTNISTNVSLIVRTLNASQTADLQQWQNTGGTVLSKVDISGNITAASFVKTSGTSAQFLKADGSVDSSTYLTTGTASSTYQPLDADLTAIAGLAGTSGFLKKTAADTWTLDTATYLTGNQTVTLSGDITGSGATSITTTLANSGVSSGTYNNVATEVRPFTVDAKGRITSIGTAVTIAPTWSNIASKPTTLSGFGITDALDTSATAQTKSGNLTAASFIKTGGTSSQFLMADGSTSAGGSGSSIAFSEFLLIGA